MIRTFPTVNGEVVLKDTPIEGLEIQFPYIAANGFICKRQSRPLSLPCLLR